MAAILLPSYDQLDQIISNITADPDDKLVMGVYWNKTSNPVLTRTDDAIGKVAAAGVDGALVTNDFDRMPIYREMIEETDAYGNVFIRIPKFYIKKTDGPGFKTIKISKFARASCIFV